MKKFNENENNRMKILAILTKLRQICNSPTLFKEDYKGEVAKLQVLRDLLPDITENGHRLLIFFAICWDIEGNWEGISWFGNWVFLYWWKCKI